MSAALFAATAAVCFALSYITLAFGLRTTPPVKGVVISLASSTAVSAGALVLDWPTSLSAPALAFFVAGGLVAPGLSRLTSTLGVERLGPSLAVPLQSGVRPLLAVLAAGIVLSEQIGVVRFAAAVAISLGLARLSWSARRGPIHAAPRPPATHRPFPALGIAYPLLTGALFAVADVLKKQGLNEQSNPLLGALVSTLTAAALWGSAAVGVRPLRRMVTVGGGTFWFVVTGALIALANIALMYALRAGEVSVVGPISATSPLVVFVLSLLLLRDIERLRVETVVWGTLVVAGTVALATS